jgi:dTDP-4-amino-4,6-dideoxygalactose transaminase
MERIDVTKTSLPPIKEYQKYLQQIWSRRQLTNQGPLLREFESEARKYLSVKNFHFVANGTLALQVALRALDITEGEIITTPFTYVATTSAVLWERCKPVFVDIEPETFCIDADKIEAAITDQTRAIMAVHVFGNPADVEKITAIAAKYNLKVIFDAAHAFGVEYGGKSLLSYGDVSTCSFHATKLFHTIEGGAVILSDDDVSSRVELIKRFGHEGDDHYMLGINAKSSEFCAAMGLCNLNYVNENINKRRQIFEHYNSLLGGGFRTPVIKAGTKPNYAYYPVVMNGEEELLSAVASLNKHNIFPRRYFYPSLNRLPYLSSGQSCPVAERTAASIMCLPLYPELGLENVERIYTILKEANVT